MRFLVLLLPSLLFAHEFAYVDTRLTLEQERFSIEMVCDLDALALGQAHDHSESSQLETHLRKLSKEERDAVRKRLTSLFERRVRVRFDDMPTSFSVKFPHEGELEKKGVHRTYFGTVVRLEGSIPAGAENVCIFASRSFAALRLSLAGPNGVIGKPMPIPAGQRSEIFYLAELAKK